MGEPIEKVPTRPVDKPARGEDTWHPLLRLREDMERLFDDVFSSVSLPFGFRQRELTPFRTMERIFGAAAPAVDLVEKEGAYELTAELPGLEEKDVRLTLSNNRLTLRGEKKEATEERQEGYFIAERRFGSFERSFRLPEDVNSEAIDASFRNGVLVVTLPKHPAAAPPEKKIEIKTA